MIRDPNTIKDPIDRDAVIYQNGFDAGQQHQHSAPETIKRIEDLQKHNEEMFKMLQGIHHCLFGFEGEGGLVHKIDRIDLQTQETNGRVTKQEKWSYGLGTAWAAGAGIIIFFIIYIGLPAYKDLVAEIKKINNDVIIHIAQDKELFSKASK